MLAEMLNARCSERLRPEVRQARQWVQDSVPQQKMVKVRDFYMCLQL